MIRDTKITDADISIRLKNICKAAEIETIGELLDIPRRDLLTMYRFGRISMQERDLLELKVDGEDL